MLGKHSVMELHPKPQYWIIFSSFALPTLLNYLPVCLSNLSTHLSIVYVLCGIIPL